MKSYEDELATCQIHNYTGRVLTERGLLLARSALAQVRGMGVRSAPVQVEARQGASTTTFVAIIADSGALTS